MDGRLFSTRLSVSAPRPRPGTSSPIFGFVTSFNQTIRQMNGSIISVTSARSLSSSKLNEAELGAVERGALATKKTSTPLEEPTIQRAIPHTLKSKRVFPSMRLCNDRLNPRSRLCSDRRTKLLYVDAALTKPAVLNPARQPHERRGNPGCALSETSIFDHLEIFFDGFGVQSVSIDEVTSHARQLAHSL
jgi:hypothetical protein